MADSAKDRALFQQWITSPAAGYCRQNPDGSRYDWAAEEQKRKRKPAAWLAVAADGSESSAVYMLREQADAAAREWGWFVVPLYRSPTLTDEEREAVEAFANSWPCIGVTVEQNATLRSLLARLA